MNFELLGDNGKQKEVHSSFFKKKDEGANKDKDQEKEKEKEKVKEKEKDLNSDSYIIELMNDLNLEKKCKTGQVKFIFCNQIFV